MWLRKYISLLALCPMWQSFAYGDDKNFTCVIGNKGINVTYSCVNLFNLEIVDRIPGNVTNIVFGDSNIVNIHGNAFKRFGASLISLDIHTANVVTMDYYVFAGLYNLQSLSLYGNNLSYIYATWFTDLSSLRTLDVSFNYIVGMEIGAFQLLSNLEYFYLDGNLFSAIDWNALSYMPKLKRVNIGKNPWIWTYRALLLQFLDDRGIYHDNDWEDWRWINSVIWECVATARINQLNDQIIDCVAVKLFIYANENLNFQNSTSQHERRCDAAASKLIACSRNNSVIKTTDEAVRMSLQGLFHIIKPMEHSGDEFRLH